MARPVAHPTTRPLLLAAATLWLLLALSLLGGPAQGQGGGPDLFIRNVGPMQENGNSRIDFVVENQGDAPAHDIYVNVTAEDGRTVASERWATLAAGASRPHTIWFPMVVGDHGFRIEADVAGAMPDTDPADNVYQEVLTFEEPNPRFVRAEPFDDRIHVGEYHELALVLDDYLHLDGYVLTYHGITGDRTTTWDPKIILVTRAVQPPYPDQGERAWNPGTYQVSAAFTLPAGSWDRVPGDNNATFDIVIHPTQPFEAAALGVVVDRDPGGRAETITLTGTVGGLHHANVTVTLYADGEPVLTTTKAPEDDPGAWYGGEQPMAGVDHHRNMAYTISAGQDLRFDPDTTFTFQVETDAGLPWAKAWLAKEGEPHLILEEPLAHGPSHRTPFDNDDTTAPPATTESADPDEADEAENATKATGDEAADMAPGASSPPMPSLAQRAIEAPPVLIPAALSALAVVGVAAVHGARFLFDESTRMARIAKAQARPRWWHWMSGLALFSRLQKDDLLDHEKRAAIFNLVRLRPGIHYQGIRRELELPNGVLTYHLGALTREGLIRGERDGRLLRMFPGTAKMHTGRALTGVERQMLRIVHHEPGLLQTELTNRLGVSKQAVQRPLKRLVDAGLIDAVQQGRTKALRVDGTTLARLVDCAECPMTYERPGHDGGELVCPGCGAQARQITDLAGPFRYGIDHDVSASG